MYTIFYPQPPQKCWHYEAPKPKGHAKVNALMKQLNIKLPFDYSGIGEEIFWAAETLIVSIASFHIIHAVCIT